MRAYCAEQSFITRKDCSIQSWRYLKLFWKVNKRTAILSLTWSRNSVVQCNAFCMHKSLSIWINDYFRSKVPFLAWPNLYQKHSLLNVSYATKRNTAYSLEDHIQISCIMYIKYGLYSSILRCNVICVENRSTGCIDQSCVYS